MQAQRKVNQVWQQAMEPTCNQWSPPAAKILPAAYILCSRRNP